MGEDEKEMANKSAIDRDRLKKKYKDQERNVEKCRQGRDIEREISHERQRHEKRERLCLSPVLKNTHNRHFFQKEGKSNSTLENDIERTTNDHTNLHGIIYKEFDLSVTEMTQHVS